MSDGPVVQSEIIPTMLDRRGTLHPYVNDYIRGRTQRKEIVHSTARAAKTILGGFADTFGRRELRVMSRADVLRYQESIAHLSIGTRRNRLSVTKSFVSWLQLEGRIRNDPFVGIKFPRAPRRVPRGLTRAETDRLWAVLPDLRAKAIIALMLGMGLRRIEVLRAQLSDWDRHKQTLRVVGKGGHERLLPVPEHVAVILAEYCQTFSHGPMIRPQIANGRDGVSNSQIGNMVRLWMEQAGVKQRPGDGKACHSLRHTLASEMADHEPDIRVVQDMLGHASLASTQIYVRGASIAKMRQAMEAVGPQSRRGAPTERCQTLTDELLRVLTAIRVTYAEEAATAAMWVQLGQFDVARALAAEIDYLERAAGDLVDSDAGWQIVHELADASDLCVSLDEHDPLVRAARRQLWAEQGAVAVAEGRMSQDQLTDWLGQMDEDQGVA